MYTALVSPDYAERFGQAVTVAGGFIAHGLISPHTGESPHQGWFYALLPGRPEAADPAEVAPFPHTGMEEILSGERNRYLEMARRHNDPVWRDAASAVADMLHCLRRSDLNRPADERPRECATGG